jgi:hypothetical protein
VSIAAGPAAWHVHLPTALETRIRAVGRADPGAPWPSARALDVLLAAGAARCGPPRAVGAGRGLPLIASQALRWAGVELEVECVAHPAGLVESALAAPTWDELAGGAATEAEWWELVDGFLAAVDAHHGAVTDGEALDPSEPLPRTLPARLGCHLGLLVGEPLAAAAGSRAAAYRRLPRSGLVLLLR